MADRFEYWKRSVKEARRKLEMDAVALDFMHADSFSAKFACCVKGLIARPLPLFAHIKLRLGTPANGSGGLLDELRPLIEVV
jgi:hypothetical protein